MVSPSRLKPCLKKNKEGFKIAEEFKFQLIEISLVESGLFLSQKGWERDNNK